MKVKDILAKKGGKVLSIQRNAKSCEALKLMNEKHIGALIVMEDEEIVGIMTERDILYKIYNKDGNLKGTDVGEVMTEYKKLVIGRADQDLESIMDLMTSKKVRHIPIMDGKELLGLISIGDIVEALLFVAKAEHKILQEYITSAY